MATTPQVVPQAPPNASAPRTFQARILFFSSQAKAAMSVREGVVKKYYNDDGNNCSYGVGTKAHDGPCTEEEIKRKVTSDEIVTDFQHGITVAERAVKGRVTRQLTQDQFDALVSFTYNVGARRASDVLNDINLGEFDQAAKRMKQYVYTSVRGTDGRPMLDKQKHTIKRFLPGLALRREEEAKPFETVPGAAK